MNLTSQTEASCHSAQDISNDPFSVELILVENTEDAYGNRMDRCCVDTHRRRRRRGAPDGQEEKEKELRQRGIK